MADLNALPTRNKNAPAGKPVNMSIFQRLMGAGRMIITGVAPDAWMSPLQPLPPSAFPVPRGRLWSSPVGYNQNLNPRPYDQDTFATLRALAETCDMVRLLIEKRKDQLVAMPWVIKQRAKPGQPQNAITVTPETEKKIAALTVLLHKPDGRHTWEQWLRALLEDMIVCDAATLYRQKDMVDRVIGYEPMDGTTICVKIDDHGRVPLAPDVGYQQVLNGIQAVDYTSDDIMYMPRNVRTFDPYGYSIVEQIITTINIMIRRLSGQLNYYDASNLPAGLLELPEDFSAADIEAFMEAFNAKLGGNYFERTSMHGVPQGSKFTEIKPAPLVEQMTEEWFARIVCFAFGISPQPFVRDMNKGTAKTSVDSAMSEGLTPIMIWIKSIMDQIIITDMGLTDLEFAWHDDREQDPYVAMQVNTGYRNASVMSVNEVRAERGLAPDPRPEANDPLWQPVAVSGFGNDDEDPNGEDPEDETKGGKKPPEDDDGSEPEPEVDKVTKAVDKAYAAIEKAMSKGVRRIRPVPFDRAAVRGNRAAMAKEVKRVFDIVGQHASAQFRGGTNTLRKDATEEADLLNLDGLTILAETSQTFIHTVAADSGVRTLQAMDEHTPQLTNIVDRDAVDYARARAAEMVGRRYEGGRLVDNPNAQWRIDTSTRDELRRVIADGLEQNIGRDEIANNIRDSFAFSDDRAELIASVEVGNANSAGTLNSYHAARDAGVIVKKAWLADSDPCPICQANEDAGAIDLDDTFPSGDDAPLAHPNCECTTIPVIEDQPDDE